MRPAHLLLLLTVVTTAALLGDTTTTASDDDHIVISSNFTCSPTGNYTDDSPYGKNVAELLSVLSAPAPATVDNWWFRSLTVGKEPGPGNNNASGLAMCWADSDAARCLNCLAAVGPDVVDIFLPECHGSRNVSFISSDRCVIRYAEAPFFGTADRSGARLVFRSFLRASDAVGMREARGRLLSQLANIAGGDALRFATGSLGYVDAARGVRQVMYGMAQCTRDLPFSECTTCLLDHLAVMYRDDSVNDSTEAGSVMGFSCYLRYQLNQPIDIAGLAQPPSPAEQPAGSSARPPLVGNTMLVSALALTAGAIVTLFNA